MHETLGLTLSITCEINFYIKKKLVNYVSKDQSTTYIPLQLTRLKANFNGQREVSPNMMLIPKMYDFQVLVNVDRSEGLLKYSVRSKSKII